MNVEQAEKRARSGARVRPAHWRGGWVEWDTILEQFVDGGGHTSHVLRGWWCDQWVVLRKRGDSAAKLVAALADAGTLRAELGYCGKSFQQYAQDYSEATVRADKADRELSTAKELAEVLEERAEANSRREQHWHSVTMRIGGELTDVRATVVRLEGELATAKAAAPRFKAGDKVLYGNAQGAGTVSAAFYRVILDVGGYSDIELSDRYITPAPEAPAVPVEVWHDCSVETAIDKFVHGARVRLRGTWEDDAWLRIDGGRVVDDRGHEASEDAGQLFTERDGWQWAVST